MATTYDKASLVMIPSGVKESKLYSVKPTDGSGDFTFSRGTDTATRVNSSGLIEKERANFLKYSQDFANAAWVALNSTKTTGQTDPNGGSTAVKIVSTGVVNSGLYQQDVSSFGTGQIRTSSIWLKGEVGGEVVQFGDATNRTQVTLTTDWVRYEGFADDDSTFFVIYNIGSVQTWYAAFAQYEDGLVATDYIETTTAAVYEGITDNLPRLDYSGGASCPSLLLEPSRSNLIPQSEYAGTGYTAQNATFNINDAISPEGLNNAFKVVEDTATGVHGLYYQITSSVSTTYAISIFAKKAERTLIKLSCGGTAMTGSGGSGADQDAIFDLENGVVSNSAIGAKIETIGNGWYKCSVVITTDSDGGSFVPYFRLVESGTTSSYTGDGTSGAYFYGFQVEAGSHPTSYIPTYGTSASRAQDLSVTASPSTSQFGQTEGTIFTEIEINAITSGSYSRILNLKNSGGSNQIYIQQNDSRINGVVFNGSNQFSASTSSGFLSVGSVYKIALAYKDSDYALYVNGTQIGTGSASGLGTLSVDRLDFTTGAGNIGLGNEVKQSLVFNTRLTNAELAALTTI